LVCSYTFRIFSVLKVSCLKNWACKSLCH
jgi:hypothetical protein